MNLTAPWLTRTFLASLGVAWLFAGCATATWPLSGWGPVYQPDNIYGSDTKLPDHLRRVAVLPIAAGHQLESEHGQDTLQPVLQTELGKTKRFELIWITPEWLQTWTGKRTWSAAQPIPPSLERALIDQFGCDGIFFSELTRYEPYTPLALGWNFKLVDLKSAQILWGADEIFDARDPRVSSGAKSYQSKHSTLCGSLADSRSILVSPTAFGHYTVDAIFAKLAPR
jgi:hypothetical protein